MNLNHLFDLSFIGRRDSVALEFAGRTFTFGEIDARANRMANALSCRGLKLGDRLCVYLANCVEMIDLYLACTRLGVIFVPINILYREREIAHIVADAEPAAFVSAAELPSLAAEAAALPPERPDITLDGDTPAGIIYTSGTTGASKGAILTHNNFASNALNLIACWKICEADRFLLTLPASHRRVSGKEADDHRAGLFQRNLQIVGVPGELLQARGTRPIDHPKIDRLGLLTSFLVGGPAFPSHPSPGSSTARAHRGRAPASASSAR